MKAAVLHELGGLPRYEEFAEPVAGPDEVLVRVLAAALKPIDRQLARGSHYASPRELPVVCGMDGVGKLEDGSRVFFAAARRPFGAMAEKSVTRREFCFPVSARIDDMTGAALPNPGVSALLTLTQRAKLAAGETVLILGATGVTGQLAVRMAKLLGAKRVIGAGRDERRLARLRELGADSTIRIDADGEALRDAFAREAGEGGFDVIVDYLWGRPTEALLAAITRPEFAAITKETRLVQVGESAGAAISLPAAVLRSTALTITGTAGIPSREILLEAMEQVLKRAAKGELRIETDPVALAEIEKAWGREEQSGRRTVVIT